MNLIRDFVQHMGAAPALAAAFLAAGALAMGWMSAERDRVPVKIRVERFTGRFRRRP